MNRNLRPLSPHLTIYRWPITMILSIMHRATGVALSIGLILLSSWLVTLYLGEQAYALFTLLMTSPLGSLALYSWSFSFFFHFCNGVRHLYWDTGRGCSKRKVELSAHLVIITSILLTVIFWWLI